MSEDDIAFVRGLYEQEWSRGEFNRVDMFDPEVEFVTDYPEPATYHGQDGVARGWASFAAAWDQLRIRLEDLTELDDGRILALIEWCGRGRASGAEVEHAGATIYTMQEGRIARCENIWDRADARRAAGIEG